MKTFIIILVALLGISWCAASIAKLIGKLKKPERVKAEILETIFEVLYYGPILTGVVIWFLLKCPS